MRLASLIHPNDLNSVGQHYQRLTILEASDILAVSYRMKRADGHWCLLRCQETPLIIASDGFPLLVLGFTQVRGFLENSDAQPG